jgi:hypothetical protein
MRAEGATETAVLLDSMPDSLVSRQVLGQTSKEAGKFSVGGNAESPTNPVPSSLKK